MKGRDAEKEKELSMRSLSHGPKCVIELLALCKRDRYVDNLNNTRERRMIPLRKRRAA
jgi:hypothetical protein